MTGGNQLRLSAVVTGTLFGEALHAAHRAGVAVGGTSAGASVLSTHMVAFGTGGATPKQRMTQLAAGLGLLPGCVIDQHFEQRNRYGRLLSLVAQSPSLLGIGIDEDTAAVVQDARWLSVAGTRCGHAGRRPGDPVRLRRGQAHQPAAGLGRRAARPARRARRSTSWSGASSTSPSGSTPVRPRTSSRPTPTCAGWLADIAADGVSPTHLSRRRRRSRDDDHEPHPQEDL